MPEALALNTTFPLSPLARQLEEMGDDDGASAPSSSSRTTAKPRTLSESCRVLADVAEPPNMKQVWIGKCVCWGYPASA